MDPDDLLQVWSFNDEQIVRLVGPDFIYWLYSDDPNDDDRLEVRGPIHLLGDFRRYYSSASSRFWKRIA